MFQQKPKKQLREIKERKENHHVENDLRGLGQFQVFKDVENEPYVEVENIPVATLKQYGDQLGLEVQEGTGHHVLKVKQEMDFKKKYVHLLVTVASLSKHHETAKFYLAEKRTLSEHLAKTDTQKKQKLHAEPQREPLKHCLTCSPHATMAFRQIGLFAAHKGQRLELGREDISSILHQVNQMSITKIAVGGH